jgi:hypothetical protein
MQSLWLKRAWIYIHTIIRLRWWCPFFCIYLRLRYIVIKTCLRVIHICIRIKVICWLLLNLVLHAAALCLLLVLIWLELLAWFVYDIVCRLRMVCLRIMLIVVEVGFLRLMLLQQVRPCVWEDAKSVVSVSTVLVVYAAL